MKEQQETAAGDPSENPYVGVFPFLLEVLRGRKKVDEVIGGVLGPNTALMLVCQAALVNSQAKDSGLPAIEPSTLSSALIQMGAQVDKLHPETNCTAIFFAVKYADLTTVKLLAAAGADLHRVDSMGNSPLVNACERGNVEVVEFLLSKGVDAKRTWNPQGALPIAVNVAECMLFTQEANCISWQAMGPPEESDYVETFKLLLAAGAEVRDEVMRTKFMQVLCAELHSPGEDPAAQPLLQQAITVPGLKMALVKATMAHRAKSKGAQAVQEYDPLAVSDRRARLGQKPEEVAGAVYPRGPTGMNLAQLMRECIVLGLAPKEGAIRERLQYEAALRVHDSTHSTMSMATQSSAMDGAVEVTGVQQWHVETANDTAVVLPPAMVLCPRDGPVVAPVEVNGRPVQAFISTASPLTVVSRAFVERAGLGLGALRSAAFCSLQAAPLPECRRVDPFTVTLGQGKTQASLRVGSAICVVGGGSAAWPRDLQLGQDFFLQAVRCQLDVFAQVSDEVSDVLVSLQPDLGSDQVKIIHSAGGGGEGPPESLRLHTPDGGTAVVALQHCRDGLDVGTVTVLEDGSLDMCLHCGAPFPNLSQCSVCKAAGVSACYCGAECQRANWKVHKRTAPHRASMSGGGNAAKASAAAGKKESSGSFAGKPKVAEPGDGSTAGGTNGAASIERAMSAVKIKDGGNRGAKNRADEVRSASGAANAAQVEDDQDVDDEDTDLYGLD